MSIKKKEIDKFINLLEKDIEEFTFKIKMHSQSKNEDEIVNLYEDAALSDEIEVMIISLSQFAEKSDIKIYVGEIGNR